MASISYFLLAFIGAVVVTGLLAQVLRLLRVKFRLPRACDLKELGSFVVITGATDGIGRAVAAECAKKGLNLLLIGRSKDKLQDVKSEIASIGKVEVQTFTFDYGSKGWDAAGFAKLVETIRKLDVAMLYYCAGVSYPAALYFDELSEEVLDEILSVNIRGCMKTVQAVLPGMRKKQRGAIVCVGSGASALPSEPLYCAYTGSKAAVESFCRSLQVEVAGDNIMVTCQMPLLVASKLSKIRKGYFTVSTPGEYAKVSLAAVECAVPTDSAVTSISPLLIHGLIILLANLVPYFLWNRYRMKAVLSLRKRYMEKNRN